MKWNRVSGYCEERKNEERTFRIDMDKNVYCIYNLHSFNKNLPCCK